MGKLVEYVLGGPETPAMPDMNAAAERTAQSNLEMAKYVTSQNRIDQDTPFGSMTYTNSGGFDQAGYDAAMEAYQNSYQPGTQKGGYWKTTGNGGDQGYDREWVETGGNGGTYGLPEPNRDDFTLPDKWTQTTTLTPELQAALDSQLAMQQGRSDIALGLMPQAEEAITTPIDYDSMQQWSTAPETSQFESYNSAPTLQGMGDAPDLQTRLRTDNLQDVNALSRNDITDMPQFDQNYVNMVKNQTLDYMRPDMQAKEQALEANLAAQGLRPGSEAYDRAKRRLADQQSRDEYNALRLGMDQGNTMYRNQMAANNQLFGQRRDVFNSELAANQNQFGQNQAAGQFRNASLSAQNQMNMGNRGFNNQNALAIDQAGFRNNQAANALKERAYNQQMQNSAFNNQVRQSQIAEAIQRQQVPLNNMNALMNGQQVSMPNMPAFNQAQRAQAAQYLNAGQMQYNADLQAQQMNNASANSFMNGAFQLGGQLGGAYLGNPMAFSDRRLKTNIQKLGQKNGFNWYRFSYLGSDLVHEGVMADEIKKIKPEAVVRHQNGYDMVNYAMLGVQ